MTDTPEFDLGDGSEEPSKPAKSVMMEVPEITPRSRWVDSIRLGVMAATAHLSFLRDSSEDKNLELKSVSRRGRIVVCQISGAVDVSNLKPGTRVKLITSKPAEGDAMNKEEYGDDCDDLSGYPSLARSSLRFGTFSEPRNRTESSVLDAEIKSVLAGEQDGGFTAKIVLNLTSKGPVFENDSTPPKIVVPNNSRHFEGYSDLLRHFTGCYPEQILRSRDPVSLKRPESMVLDGRFPSVLRQSGQLETSPDLDEAQNVAYGMAMNPDRYPVVFVHGGPGTGKTRTICKIIEDHVKRGRKVLLLSHSNKGAQVPALMLKQYTDVEVNIAGNDASAVDQRLHKDRIKRGLNFPVAALRKINSDDPPEESIDEMGLSGPKQYKDVKKAKILDEYRARLFRVKRKFQEKMRKGGAVFSTLGTFLNDEIIGRFDFDVVIVDEATRLRMPDMLLALSKADVQIIFVGDPLQLGNIPLDPQVVERLRTVDLLGSVKREMGFPADPLLREIHDPITCARRLLNRPIEGSTPLENIARETTDKIIELYEEGPFSRGILQCDDPEKELSYVFLDKDRRSLPNIVRVLSELMYKGKLFPGREPKEGEHDGIVQWIDTGSIKAKEKTAGTSRRNPKEADIVVRMLLDTVLGRKVPPEDVAVIATYAEQAELIKTKLSRFLYNSPEFLKKLLANVASVDAFQGDERKIVFVSLTRSNKEGAIGFLEEERRLGVAVGRAQDELYVVGDMRTLVETNNNSQSKEFFGKMHGLIKQYGEAKKEQYRSPKKRRKKKHHKEPAKIAAVA